MTIPITPTQLDELEALERDGTPLPWKQDIGVYEDLDGDEDMAFARGPLLRRKRGESYDDLKERARRDSQLSCALRNAAPSLFAALRAAWARIEELERERNAAERAAESLYRLLLANQVMHRSDYEQANLDRARLDSNTWIATKKVTNE